MIDLNEIKAGKYQLVAASWEHITSKPGEPLDFTRYTRGDVVDLDVEDAKRLFAAGAVVKPGQLEKAAVERARAEFEQAQTQLQALLSGLPERSAEVAPGTVPAQPDTPTVPVKSASKVDWVAYATDAARGDQVLTAEAADALTRDQLVERFTVPGAGVS